jgi:ADP-heptose:LPS heptosyltransferase
VTKFFDYCFFIDSSLGYEQDFVKPLIEGLYSSDSNVIVFSDYNYSIPGVLHGNTSDDFESFVKDNVIDCLISVDSIVPAILRERCNCLALLVLSNKLLNRDSECFDSHKVDAVLCSSPWHARKIQSKIPSLSNKVRTIGSITFVRQDIEHFVELDTIAVICLSNKEREFFERCLRHPISSSFSERTKKPVRFKIANGTDLRSDLEGCYLAIIPGVDDLSWKPILDWCSCNAIPVVSGDKNDLFYNHPSLRSVSGDAKALVDNCVIDDLSREQLSYKVYSGYSRGFSISALKSLIDFLASTSPYRVEHEQKVTGIHPYGEIWLHVGTGIGDMLLLGSVLRPLKAMYKGLRICVSVKENDDSEVAKGRRVFNQLFRDSPYIDRVEFLTMEKKDGYYCITAKELEDRGIDSRRIFSIDVVPAFLMRNRAQRSALDEISRCLGVIPDYHQELKTNKVCEVFGAENSNDNTVIFCMEGSPIHEGRHNMGREKVESIISGLRSIDAYKDHSFIGIGFGDDDRAAWHEEVFDKSFYGETTIGQDIELIRNCGLMVSVDTGMAHVALNLGVNFIGLYHQVNFPYWVAPYYRNKSTNRFVISKGSDLSGIEPEGVVKAAHGLLAPHKPPETVVIVHPGGRGDNIMIEPAVRELSLDKNVHMVTNFPSLWENNLYVNKLSYMGMGDDPSFHSKNILGNEVINTYPLLLNENKGSMIDNYCELLGVSPENRSPDIYLSKEEMGWGEWYCSRFKKPIVAIHTHPACINKSWDYWKWDSLIKNIESMNFDVVELGAVDENLPCERMKVADYTEKEMFSALAHCSYIISVDSVFMHAAKAIEMKGVVIWCSTDPDKYGYDSFVNINMHQKLDCAPCGRPKFCQFDFSKGKGDEIVPFMCPHRSCSKLVSVDHVINAFITLTR